VDGVYGELALVLQPKSKFIKATRIILLEKPFFSRFGQRFLCDFLTPYAFKEKWPGFETSIALQVVFFLGAPEVITTLPWHPVRSLSATNRRSPILEMQWLITVFTLLVSSFSQPPCALRHLPATIHGV
jgi:hypothetical protein